MDIRVRDFVQRYLPLLEVVIVVAIVSVTFIDSMPDVAYFYDESFWIASSDVLEPMLRFDTQNSVWNESYSNRTQPPGSKYLIGLGRLAGGYHVSDLVTPWNWKADAQTNFREGNIPNAGLLWWSRLPMVLLATGTAAITFFLIRKSAGRLAAVVFFAMFLVNPYLRSTLTLAMSESPLLFFTCLAALCLNGFAAAQDRWSGSGGIAARGWALKALWTLGFCVAAGVAGLCKLNGLAIVVSFPILLILVAVFRWPAGRGPVQYAGAAITVLAAGLVSCVVFVGLNPYLYEKPVDRSRGMVENRLQEMSIQQRYSPAAAIHGPMQRARIVPRAILARTTTVRFPGSITISGILVLVGVGWSAHRGLRWLRTKSLLPAPASLVLLITGFTSSLPVALTPLDWDRYYMFPVYFSVAFMAIALGSLASWPVSRLRQGLADERCADSEARRKDRQKDSRGSRATL